MQLRFDETKIEEIAKRYEYPGEEDELIELKEVILNQGHITKAQLTQVAKWKSPRSAGHITKNSNDYVQEITSFAFSTKDERARIESLTILDGVSWPTASVLLHLFHMDPYPILDFRALWSVCSEVPNQYKFAFWMSYVVFCREHAKKNGVSMRTLDRALWQYSKENQ